MVGHVTGDLTNVPNAAGETVIGNVIADAQLEATRSAFGAVVAFMNPGGIRGELLFAPTGAEGNGVVTYAKAFTVQPFANILTVVDLKGSDIKAALEQQFTAARTRVLQISDSLRYTYTAASPFGSKVDPATILINGTLLDMNATYRVVVNNFLAGGGDGFAALAKGANKVSGPIDLDALIQYVGAFDPAGVTPPALGRITLQ